MGPNCYYFLYENIRLYNSWFFNMSPDLEAASCMKPNKTHQQQLKKGQVKKIVKKQLTNSQKIQFKHTQY